MFLKKASLYFFLLVLLVSCSKGGGDTTGGPDNGNDPHVFNPTDITSPTLNINTPLASQVFSSGNTIQVSGRVTDDYGLYRGNIRIVNDANGVEVKQQAYEIHGLKTYDYNLAFLTNVTVATDYTIIVFFEDHGYNGATKTVKVKVNP